MRRQLITAAFLLLALAGSISAQQPQSQQRGVTADTSFSIGDIDAVNLLNGGLTLRLPLGQSYPVGPSLSYGFTLSYSSSGWDFEDQQSCTVGSPPNLMLAPYNLPIQDPNVNSGWGWRLNLGELRPIEGTPVSPFSGWSLLTEDGELFQVICKPGSITVETVAQSPLAENAQTKRQFFAMATSIR